MVNASDSPKVSVILPTYNRSEYLVEAVGGVIAQSMDSWELLVINDGGVDIAPLLNKFNDPRIRYHPFPDNRGKAVCCNFALQEARGRYMAYLDDDDRWYPHHLETLAGVLDRRPEAAGVYSDLYCVNYVEDPISKRRIPVTKAVKASRDFNREAMWGVNLALHVSFMHRREAAFRAGGYNDGIKVFIDWNLTRKMAFLYDLIHVQRPTGEFFAPVFQEQSQRISDVGRRDSEKFKHALRMIKADLPPEPWPRVRKISILLPVERFDDELSVFLARIMDNLHHPFDMVLMDIGSGLGPPEARAALGETGSLRNIRILDCQGVSPAQAYLRAAEEIDSELIFAADYNLQPEAVPVRFLAGLEALYRGGFSGVKWNTPQESGPLNLLMDRLLFIKNFKKIMSGTFRGVARIAPFIPEAVKADATFQELVRLAGSGDFEKGRKAFDFLINDKQGGFGAPALIPHFLPICYGLRDFEAAERACRELIRQGYEPDNFLRLGQVLRLKGEYGDAVRALEKGLASLGFYPDDLDSAAFPGDFVEGPDVFMAFVFLGDCLLKQGKTSEARSAFQNALKIRKNSGISFPIPV